MRNKTTIKYLQFDLEVILSRGVTECIRITETPVVAKIRAQKKYVFLHWCVSLMPGEIISREVGI